MVLSFSRISSSVIFFFLIVVLVSWDGVALGVVADPAVIPVCALPKVTTVVVADVGLVVGDEAIGELFAVLVLFDWGAPVWGGGSCVGGVGCWEEAMERAIWCWGLLRLLVLLVWLDALFLFLSKLDLWLTLLEVW